MSKPIIMLIALAALGTAPAAIVQAQGHAHTAPHGGIVVTVGDHHFELVAEAKQFSVYVLDSHEAGMSIAGMTAHADILAKGKPKSSVDLTVAGDHFVGAQALDPVGPTTLIITVKSAGKSLIGRFKYPAP